MSSRQSLPADTVAKFLVQLALAMRVCRSETDSFDPLAHQLRERMRYLKEYQGELGLHSIEETREMDQMSEALLSHLQDPYLQLADPLKSPLH